MEGFTCKTPPKPMAEFIKRKDVCGPCHLAPLAANYFHILNQGGQKDLADKLQAVYNTQDEVAIAKEMDNIKTQVDNKIKSELVDMDCFAQTIAQEEH